ncbi:hypothetical protein LTR86_010137 [Recurvomyces mirabilis]|nr:hypothetical protein LTR86_010137 [Recurvomyces mirabilis]
MNDKASKKMQPSSTNDNQPQEQNTLGTSPQSIAQKTPDGPNNSLNIDKTHQSEPTTAKPAVDILQR